VDRAEAAIGRDSRRLHCLSVPPSAALSAVRLLGEAGLVEHSRIVMEKPFGTDLASPVKLNSQLHDVFAEQQISRIDHFLGKEPAQNILAFREPPKSMFPANSGVGAQGPDHLTFDLADASKMSLSFYGKRPGPGMRLDKLSLQFAMRDTGLMGEVLEAYERLILDAMRGVRTLFTTAEGIERLWQVSTYLLEAPPPVRLYEPGSWGPKSIHQLIAPHAWRPPFERAWRNPDKVGG
jgi:glucose-6-phosphate 1-dehydrogenase